MGYCGNWGGGSGNYMYATAEDCANRCLTEFNSNSFALYLSKWGYSNNYCECVPSPQTCSVRSSSEARNFKIKSSCAAGVEKWPSAPTR